MKVRLYVMTNKIGSKCEEVVEVPDDEIEDMDQKEIEEYIKEVYMLPFLQINYEYGFEILYNHKEG